MAGLLVVSILCAYIIGAAGHTVGFDLGRHTDAALKSTVGYELGRHIDEALKADKVGVDAAAQSKLANFYGDNAIGIHWADRAVAALESAQEHGQAALSAMEVLFQSACISSDAYRLLLTLKPALEYSLLPTVEQNLKIIATWIEDINGNNLIGTTDADTALMEELVLGGYAPRVGRVDARRAFGGFAPCGLNHGLHPFHAVPESCVEPKTSFASMPTLFLQNVDDEICRRYSASS
mmetsp:Transcript_45737/g.132445  ORF Transcript_45737/g.132445 Transcript_45737/m.132445 type:complete len:236 (+) Transcript_45737:110-817(+)